MQNRLIIGGSTPLFFAADKRMSYVENLGGEKQVVAFKRADLLRLTLFVETESAYGDFEGKAP